MKLHDFGFWYQKRTRRGEEYCKVYSPGFDVLLFDGNCIAIKDPDDGPWAYEFYDLDRLVKLFDSSFLVHRGHGSYAFRKGYIPKPEDFEVIREAS